MSFTLRAALGFRSRMGPKTGLAVLRPLIDQLTGADRARAILGALECARALSDEASYEAVLAQWVGVEATGMFEALAEEVGAARTFSLRLAQELAHAERIRAPEDARAHYLLARVSDGELRDASYAKALLLAARPPARESYVAQIVASMLAVGLDPGARHVSFLSQACIDQLSDPARLAIARHRLACTSGYKRVAVLDSLLEGAAGGSALALDVVTEFADRELPTPLEWDRLSTMTLAAGTETKRRFDMWHALRTGTTGGSALAHEARVVVGALDEDVAPIPKLDPGADAWAWTEQQRQAASAAYAQISKLHKGAEVDLAPFVDAATSAGGPALAFCALGLSTSTGQGPDFVRYALALVERSSARRGWLRLAKASVGRGDDVLTARLLERAVECEESGAARALGADLRRRAWAAEEHDEALALMSRARRLLGGPL